jgi:N-methylhydantoinase A
VSVADPATGLSIGVALYDRQNLRPGAMVGGPALIVEDETTTLVTAAFDAMINGLGHIVMTRRAA